MHRLSLAHIAEAAERIAPVFLRSPQYVCEPLAAEARCRLTIKVETANPIRSFKGRGTDYFVTKALERGERGPMVCASAGNFGQGMAYACRARGVAAVVFAAKSASPMKVARMRALGAEVILEGDDFDAAKAAARAWASAKGARFVEDGHEPEVAEGAGSIAVELLSGGDAFDAVVVPLGDGALLGGMARWIKDVSPSTRVVGVCARGAPAMYDSWLGGAGAAPVVHERVDTIADGIAVRAPVAASLADLHGLVDDVVLVDDGALVSAMRLVRRHAGLVTKPAGVAGLAAILEDRARFEGMRVATVLCGGNVDEESAQ